MRHTIRATGSAALAALCAALAALVLAGCGGGTASSSPTAASNWCSDASWLKGATQVFLNSVESRGASKQQVDSAMHYGGDLMIGYQAMENQGLLPQGIEAPLTAWFENLAQVQASGQDVSTYTSSVLNSCQN